MVARRGSAWLASETYGGVRACVRELPRQVRALCPAPWPPGTCPTLKVWRPHAVYGLLIDWRLGHAHARLVSDRSATPDLVPHLVHSLAPRSPLSSPTGVDHPLVAAHSSPEGGPGWWWHCWRRLITWSLALSRSHSRATFTWLALRPIGAATATSHDTQTVGFVVTLLRAGP